MLSVAPDQCYCRSTCLDIASIWSPSPYPTAKHWQGFTKARIPTTPSFIFSCRKEHWHAVAVVGRKFGHGSFQLPRELLAKTDKFGRISFQFDLGMNYSERRQAWHRWSTTVGRHQRQCGLDGASCAGVDSLVNVINNQSWTQTK